MSEGGDKHDRPRSGITTRAVETVTALLILALGVLVIVDSVRVGRGWAADGPQAGFYPFYVGLTICACAVWVLIQQSLSRERRRFVGSRKLRPVLAILFPSIAYVAAIYFLGIYVSSALFLVGFMCWQGNYKLLKALPIGLAVPIAMFLLFEIWFKVPLPKGPLETWLGY